GEHDLGAAVADGAAHQLLVGERAVHVGGVDEGDAAVERAVDGGDRFRLAGVLVELAHPHAAEAERRDLEALPAELAVLHGQLLVTVQGGSPHPDRYAASTAPSGRPRSSAAAGRRAA